MNRFLSRHGAALLLAFIGVLSASGLALVEFAPEGLAERIAAPDFRSLVERYGPAVVSVSVASASAAADPGTRGGSGFIVTRDGYVLSSCHVIDGARFATVRLPDRREFKARVVGFDRSSDVAVLKVDATDLPTVRLGRASAMKAGDWVVAIGSPFGFDNTVTAGVVSATARPLPHEAMVQFLQSDVAVNSGNSGGPLFNMKGEVVGINSQIFSTTGAFLGISFAVPIELAEKVRDAIIRDGRVVRGGLGFKVQEVNPALAASFGLAKAAGALVVTVDSGGPAAGAGLVPGDIVTRIGAREVQRYEQLNAIVADMKPGMTAALRVWSQGAEREIPATVRDAAVESGSKPDEATDEPESRAGRLNVKSRPLTAFEEHLIGANGGLLVDSVDGSAARAGIQPGDVILAVNGTQVRSDGELQDQIASAQRAHVALLLQRGEDRLFVAVEK